MLLIKLKILTMKLLANDKNRIINHLSQDDILKKIINSNEFPVLRNSQNLFHDLMSCIIEQQIHPIRVQKKCESFK